MKLLRKLKDDRLNKKAEGIRIIFKKLETDLFNGVNRLLTLEGPSFFIIYCAISSYFSGLFLKLGI